MGTEMLPATVMADLHRYNITDFSEAVLRETLEERVETYTLIRLAPWPARRWKCRYRLMMGADFYDAQSVAEAYALALLASLKSPHNPQNR